MGLWDIIYDIIKDYRTTKGNEVKKRSWPYPFAKKHI